MDIFSKFEWRTRRSGNPNKSWVIDKEGHKLTALMSTNSAIDLAAQHNMAIAYLENVYVGKNHDPR